MTEMTNSAARTGSTRAAIPASLRSRRRARLAAPTAILAVTGVALGGIFVPGLFVQGEGHGAQNLQQASLADIAQAQAQEFDLKTASAEAATEQEAPKLEASQVKRDGVEVAVETPKPTTSSDSSSGSASYGPVTPAGEAQQIAHDMVIARGWSEGQFTCLVNLWNRESGWNAAVSNASSGAYGIPQALPGSKMSAAGADWQTNAATQIDWGINYYIAPRYGTPCGAWDHSEANGWY